MPIHLPIAHVIPQTRECLLPRLITSPPRRILRTVEIQRCRDHHLYLIIGLQGVEFAVDIEGERGVGVGGCAAQHARDAVVCAIEDARDGEGFFVEC